MDVPSGPDTRNAELVCGAKWCGGGGGWIGSPSQPLTSGPADQRSERRRLSVDGVQKAPLALARARANFANL